MLEWSWRHQWQYLLKDFHSKSSVLKDCFLLPYPGIPTVASIMIWTSVFMPSSSTYVSALKKFWNIVSNSKPWFFSMHWCPCQAEPHAPGAAGEEIRHYILQTQSGFPHPVHACGWKVAAGSPWKVFFLRIRVNFCNTLVDFLLGTVTIAWLFPFPRLFLTRCKDSGHRGWRGYGQRVVLSRHLLLSHYPRPTVALQFLE